MAVKNKTCFIILALVVQLFVSEQIAAEVEAFDSALEEETAWGSEPHHLTLVSLSPLLIEGEAAGIVAAYDDPATERPTDYFELYDNTAGNLLAVRWFDKFGIERMAVDRGFLENADKPEGVFVVLLEGDPV
jgi:hypothetical protein